MSVCIPARDEEATVGALVRHLRAHEGTGLVDEVIVLDHASTDGSAAAARDAGARGH